MKIKHNNALKDLIRQIPKTDLHVHLDGSVRLETIIDIAKREKIKLPSYTTEGLLEIVFLDTYPSLVEYLKTFEYSTSVMQNPENLERIAFELAEDCLEEGVRYLEVRFAPQLHMNKIMDMQTVLESINLGLQKAQKAFTVRQSTANESEPPFHYAMIVCALRSFGPYSEYYQNFIKAHAFSNPKYIHSMGSLELAKGAVQIRDNTDIPIVGFDLAGAEKGNPAKDHQAAFQYAHAHFMAKTVHAGEAYGAESIFQAISDLHADRIGHGYYLFDESKIESDYIIDKKKYINALSSYIANRRIPIEICLTSNLQTNPQLDDLKNHTLPEMLKRRISTTICTDNRTVSKTTSTNEIMLTIQHFDISPRLLKSIIIYGFKRGFFPGSYWEKRKYVRQCIDYYEQLTENTELKVDT